MNKIKTTTLAAIASTIVLASASFTSAAMDERVENALVDVCQSAMKGNLYRYNKTAKSYNLKDKTVALKVMCNGANIIDFADKHGATKVAQKLQRSIGGVSITDVAMVSKVNVTFEE